MNSFDGETLRLRRAGIDRCGESTTIVVDGSPREALVGETVAATLAVHGVAPLSRSIKGEDRGLFCGMGVCFECRVTINGQSGQRSCLTLVEPGMTVETQGAGASSSLDAIAETTDQEESCAVLVIGAGPAGLAAAEAAARGGADVVVLDERPSPGGQYFKPLASSHRFRDSQPSDAQFGQGLDLLRRVQALGVRIVSGTLVWDAEPQDDTVIVRALTGGRVVNWMARRLVIASGAFERAWPVPGWTLPGVITTGAAQTLSRSYQVAPGKRILFAGNGPLNLQVAADLASAGSTVVGVAEAAQSSSLSQAANILTMAGTRPDLLWAGARYLATLRQHNIPVLHRHALVRVEGSGRVERAIIARLDDKGAFISGTDVGFDVDTVCLGYGFSPASELSRLVGCEQMVDPRGGNTLIPVRDEDGRTSIPAVFVAGDAGGPWGAHSALNQGALAGLSASLDLDAADGSRGREDASRYRRAMARETRFQKALWNVFSSPMPIPPLEDDATIICRCETVPVGAVREAIDNGATDIPTIKRATRCGMGRCQGRYCSPMVATLLRDTAKVSLTNEVFFRTQAPIRPVSMASLRQPQETAPNPGPGAMVSVPDPGTNLPDTELGRPDVLVIGAGGVGLFTAMALARAGRDVVVVERRKPYSEASGANAGSLHVQFQTFGFPDLASEVARRAASTLHMQKDSVYLWRDFAAARNVDIEVEIEGGLTVADDAVSLEHLQGKVAVERAAGLQMDMISGDEARALLPELSPDIIAASYSPDEGKINPMKAAPAVLSAVLAEGVNIVSGTTVLGIETDGKAFVVRTDKGIYRPRKIVNAAGAWSGTIASMIGDALPIRQNPIQMIVSEATGIKIPYHLAHSRRRVTLKQAVAGNLVIGGGWRATINETLKAARPTRAGLGGNLAVTLELLPGFADLQVIRSWTGMAFTTPPTITASPSNPNLFHVVTQNAMTLAPVLGRTASALVLEQRPDYDIAPFALQTVK